MKILYISQYFPPEMGAPSARAAELSQHWVQAGHDVTVLTGFPNHPTGVVPVAYRGKLRRLLAREDFDSVKVVRSWLLPFPNRKAYERILNYSSFCLSAAMTGTFVDRPDVIIASSPQLLVGLSGWWIARFKRAPFVFEVRDLWPESLSAVGMAGENSLLHRSLASIAQFLYKHADRVVVVSPAFRDPLTTRWKVPPEKIEVVENGIETDLFRPENTNIELLRNLKLEGKFVVSYIGTIGMAHGLTTLIESAVQLRDSAPSVHFVVIGEGSDKERVVSLAKQNSLTNMTFIGQQPREKIPAYIAASQACLVHLKKSDVFKTVIPTKMLEFMSCGRPVILGVEGHARSIVEDAKAGVFVEPENASQLSQAILRLASDAKVREELGRNGRDYILRNFSRPVTADRYLKVLEGLFTAPAIVADKEQLQESSLTA